MEPLGIFYVKLAHFVLFFQATAEANNLAAVAGAREIYCKSMEQVCNQI